MSQVVVGELLVRSLHVHAGERVLDVAGGAGNTALAAARRWADVTCTDYVPDLLAHARARAVTEGLPLRTEVADAQALPYADETFDVVTSTFGAMFAPDQEATARELLRVLRPGGRLGLANWTPDSWVGEQFRLQASYLPPPAGGQPPTAPPAAPPMAAPMAWGTRARLEELLGAGMRDLRTSEQYVDFVHHSTASLFELFRDWFGPVATVLARLDDEQRAAFARDWLALEERHNVAPDGTCEIPAAYLQVLAVKRG